MRQLFAVLLMGLVVALLVSSINAQAPVLVTMSGYYDLSGVRPDGSAYTGVLTINRDRGVYRFFWPTTEGVGLRQGDTIAAAFGNETCGVMLYYIEEDGTLNGAWADKNQTSPGLELAIPDTGGSGFEGHYTVAGFYPDGSPYETALDITPAGSLFRLDWTTGAVGIGFPNDQIFAAAYGDNTCGVASYKLNPQSGLLEGLWAGMDDVELGFENLTRSANNPSADIVAHYTVSGTFPDGNSYNGTASIDQIGSIFHVERQTDVPLTGVGIQYGDTLAVAYGNETCGIVSSVMEPHGGLSGHWAGMGDTFDGEEFAFPESMGRSVLGGMYTVSGANNAGTSYSGTLRIDPVAGHLYTFNWETSSTYQGAGIQSGDAVAASYGDTTCEIAIYGIQADGSLSGIWAGANAQAVGTETFSR